MTPPLPPDVLNNMDLKLFGTDGIRGRAGEFPLNSQSVVAIGRAAGEKLGGNILVGQDTRRSSPWIFELLQRGLAQTAATMSDAGVIPTPAVALLTKSLGFSGGIMVSASHNPSTAKDTFALEVFYRSLNRGCIMGLAHYQEARRAFLKEFNMLASFFVA